MGDARVPVIVGPTAVGKTAVALALAAHWPIEVISADSRQIYRRLDIGTAKPTRKERARVPHHGLDVVEPGTRYSAGRFARDAAAWIEEARNRSRLPVVVGGTGLYVRALAEGLFREPELDPGRRRSLDAFAARLEPLELLRWAGRLDPGFRGGGRQRAARAIEVALLTGYPLTHWQEAARAGRRDPAVVRGAHGAAAGPAPADRAAGGGDGAPGADRGGGRRARGGPPAVGAGARRRRHSGGGRVPSRPARARQRGARRSRRAPGSTPSGRRPGSATSWRATW